MTLTEFNDSIACESPPDGLARNLVALWWAAKGNWDKAHSLIMDQGEPEAAWVHAHLHRLEGDENNAAYWYERANRERETGSLSDEREAMIIELLNA